MWKFQELVWTARDSPRTVWATSGIICVINHDLVCMRPKMAMEIGFKKIEQRYNEWAAHGQPTCSVLGL